MFIKMFIEKTVFSPIAIKNEDITNLAMAAKELTIFYMMRFSKETSNEEKLRGIFIVQNHPAKMKTIKFEFHAGSYHNISTQRSTLNNLKPL